MEGLVVLISMSLITIDLCGFAYLSRLFIKFVFKLVDIKELLEEKDG